MGDSGETSVIETFGLTKRYGQTSAVENLDMRLGPGEICALLGPNGAGTTTTILMLLGLTGISSGRARVLGFDPMDRPLEIKRRVGYLPENVGFYNDLTAAENLRFVAGLNGLSGPEAEWAIEESLLAVGLGEVSGKKAAAFSRGMRQRLGLAEVLVKKPEIMILDEPTLGLDPDGIDDILALIASLAQERNLSVLISSHLLPLVERVAHRALILKRGRAVASGRLDELAEAASLRGGLSEVYRHYFHQEGVV